uniref:Thiamine pyrophosphate enzyme N-terminal TPP binding domain protein n=1 Tax=uncultured bacterium pA1 TaxID=1776268 RepID=A0A0U3J8W4_9BACT|nr:thiamine pyrophosphate enzyme N-terminal TPP binding domain protein [uncultured bacterium pA1]
MNAAELFVRALENEGVTHVFGVPGEENLDLLKALGASKIRFVVTRHEQAAGFMAATVGRLTGKAGVCLSTLGPGATNFTTAAAYGQLGGMPMLMITGQKPIRKSKQGRFQIIDTIEIMRPLTKYARQVMSGSAVAATVREAFRVAEEERPGAVHIELPEDVAADEASGEPFPSTRVRRPDADEKALATAVGMIEAAKSPLILIGAGANRKLTSKMLREFVDKTGIPFFNTQQGKGVVDERHPLFMGTAALSDNDYLHCAIARADLIINVGHDVVEKPPFLMRPGGTKVIHVNFTSAKVDEIYFPQLEVVGDIANAVWRLKERVRPQASWDFSYFMKIKAQLDAHVVADAADARFPIIPQRIVADVRAAVPEDGIVALDNGMYKLWFARNYRAYAPNTLLLDNALASMGAGLPSAIAAKIVSPGRKVVAICGDGGFMMNSQEMETAVRLGLDLVVIVLNDGGFGMIKWKQQSMGHPDFGLDFGNPDFVKYAEAYGAKGHRVSAAAEFAPMLAAALAGKGVHLIEVPVDYSENVRVFTKELKEKTCLL